MTVDQDKDVLAAEYVLGTLGPDERAEAQALIAVDLAFAEVVRGWERRLGELSAMVDPVEPPSDMWDRIKAGVAVSDQSAKLMEPAVEALREPAKPPAAAAEAAAATTAPAVGGNGAAAAAEVAPAARETPAAAAREATAPVVATPAEAALAAAPPVAPRMPGVQPGADVIDLAQRLRRWRAAAAVTGALAACLLGLVVVQRTSPDLLPPVLQPKVKTIEVVNTIEVPSPRPVEFVAVLQRDAASPAFLLTFDLDKRTLTVRTVGAERQAGKSYELWLISDKYPAPRSLGVIGAAPYTVRPAEPEYDPVVINRATYAVSLEPEGGSPTGAPTGPVLYTGRLLQATAPDFPARTP